MVDSQNIFLTWDNTNPLILPNNALEVPSKAIKATSYYDGIEKIAYEHCQDIAFLATSFNITNNSMMMRLLALSFIGKMI